MRLIKSALCIMVIFALAVSFVPTTASASALTVVGTSFSSAGLTSAEFAASAGPYAIGILAAVASAFGIKAFTRTETGQAVKEFFQGLIEKRAEATRRSVAEQMAYLLGNTVIEDNGDINIGRLSFAEIKEILLTGDITPVRPSGEIVSLGSYRFGSTYSTLISNEAIDPGLYIYRLDFYYPPGNMANNMLYNDPDAGISVIYRAENASSAVYYKLTRITDGYEVISQGGINSYSGLAFRVGNNYLFKPGQGFLGYNYRALNLPTIRTLDIVNGHYTNEDLVTNLPSDTLYGVDETLRDQTVGLNEGLVLAPDLINSAVIGGASGQISASDYCGALVDYVSGYDTVIDGVTVTGLPEAGTVSRTIDEAPTADTVIDEAPPSTMTGTEAAGIYSFSLDELFPFCLPFDFVKIIEKFNVEPEAPNFDWRFYIPGVIDYTLHVDLSAWNTAAEVCRTMVLIAFMVGLIMLTRQIFIRA